MWCCITPERYEKTERIMRSLALGVGGKVCVGSPPDKDEFVVWGHLWLGERLIPDAVRENRPWWFIDNGWWMPARGQPEGYYSITYKSLGPILLPEPDFDRNPIKMQPWREPNSKGHILLAMPGMAHGGMLGMDMAGWASSIKGEIKKYTDRKIRVREKGSKRSLWDDLIGAHALVTHSSKVAVDAITLGVPAIVAISSPAAPVSSTSLSDLENPIMPDRSHWWASLMCQQFTLQEMKNGIAKYWMGEIKKGNPEWLGSDSIKTSLGSLPHRQLFPIKQDPLTM